MKTQIVQENVFYTYVLSKTDGTPYYVGKGRNNRYRNCGNNHARNITRSILLAGESVKITIIEAESEQHALDKEVELIKLYGRLDLHTGTLCNLTDGGDSPKFSVKTRLKMSMIAKRSWQRPSLRATKNSGKSPRNLLQEPIISKITYSPVYASVQVLQVLGNKRTISLDPAPPPCQNSASLKKKATGGETMRTARTRRESVPVPFTTRCKQRRDEMQLSQAKLARLAGIPVAYISKIERKDGHVSEDDRAALALALGIPQESLQEEV
jgi:DNA-binding transcriptional regulator YiaG